jgi:hypothetical protein
MTSRSRQASAAAPAPEHTSFTSPDPCRRRAAVEHRGADDDRRAVLVVVEDRDLHPLAQLALDVEALGRLDVLEVDAAEGRLERAMMSTSLSGSRSSISMSKTVDAGELLEQHRLAFHHRLGGERADGAEAEHGGAVGHDRDQVAARGQGARLAGIATIASQAKATPGE